VEEYIDLNTKKGFQFCYLQENIKKAIETIQYQMTIIRTSYNVLIIEKKNMLQRIKLVKIPRNCIYNGRFKCAKV